MSCGLFALGLMLQAKYERRSAPIRNIVGALAGVAGWQVALIGVHSAVSRMPTLAPALYVVTAIPGGIGALLLSPWSLRKRPGVPGVSGVVPAVRVMET
jgi:hypothetical protein